MTFDVIVVGHIAIDMNILPYGIIENALGGAPTYSGLAFVALKKRVGVVSKVGRDFVEKFPPLYSKLGVDTEGILVTGEHTTTFENTYDEAGNRTQVCKHVAPKILPDNIPATYESADSFYVSPIAGEVTPELLKALKRETNLVMLDPQGIFRRISEEGKVEIEPRDDLADFLRHVDVIKIGKEESKALRGEVKEVLEELREMGPKIAIMTKAEKGCAVLSDEGFEEVDAIKVDARDLTGAGDVFGAAFLAKYLQTHQVLASAKFANATAGLKIRYRGPTGFPSEKEVLGTFSKFGQSAH